MNKQKKLTTEFTFKEFCRAAQEVTNEKYEYLALAKAEQGEKISQRLFEAFLEQKLYSEEFQSTILLSRMIP